MREALIHISSPGPQEAEIEIAPAKGVAEQEKLDLSKDHFRLSQRRDSDNSMNTDAIQLGEQSGETCSDVMAGYRRRRCDGIPKTRRRRTPPTRRRRNGEIMGIPTDDPD